MERNHLLWLAAGMTSLSLAARAQQSQRPNVIIIYATMSWIEIDKISSTDICNIFATYTRHYASKFHTFKFSMSISNIHKTVTSLCP